jgi:hypothetical protein
MGTTLSSAKACLHCMVFHVFGVCNSFCWPFRPSISEYFTLHRKHGLTRQLHANCYMPTTRRLHGAACCCMHYYFTGFTRTTVMPSRECEPWYNNSNRLSGSHSVVKLGDEIMSNIITYAWQHAAVSKCLCKQLNRRCFECGQPLKQVTIAPR